MTSNISNSVFPYETTDQVALMKGVSIHPNRWVNIENKYFDNGSEALNYYTNYGSQFSEIIDADDMYELKCKMGEMMLNYRDEEWLNKNVYPRI